MKISVIGLGKLGACTASCFAYRSYEVVGIDNNRKTVDKIINGKAPVIEPGLQHLIKSTIGNALFASTDYSKAIEKTDISFIVVPTPSKDDDTFSLEHVKDALKKLCFFYNKSIKKYFIFVIVSTIMPGAMDLIEDFIKKETKKSFGLVYNPEFIAIGNVIKDFLHPDLVLIGSKNKSDAMLVKGIYEGVCNNNPYYALLSPIEAEITKLALNTFITMKINFANLISNLCEKHKDANVDNVTKTLGFDKRISPHYLIGGFPFGGPCFPRDVRAFNTLFDKPYNCLSKSINSINNEQIYTIAKKIKHFIIEHSLKNIGILGLSYKPGTPVIEDSPSINIIKYLQTILDETHNIVVYDPLAIENTKTVFNDKISYASSVEDCFKKAEIIVITTPNRDFMRINNSYITKEVIILDCWRMLDPGEFDDRVTYKAMGNGKYK